MILKDSLDEAEVIQKFHASQYMFAQIFENPRFNLMVGNMFLYLSQGSTLLGRTENRSENECGQRVAALRRTATARGL